MRIGRFQKVNWYGVFGLSFLALLSSSCAWNQKKTEYLYRDDGKTTKVYSDNVFAHDKDLIDISEYGAFSESIYLNDNKSSIYAEDMSTFCRTEDSLYRPKAWRKLDDIPILRDRALVHSQLGLEVEVFQERTAVGKSRVLIVFRGTDFDEKEDWPSNFRWVNKNYTKELDQYDEVRQIIPILVSQVEEQEGNILRFIATGHSLGGGLAQLAGYSTYKVDRVVAFDSSPVTGFYDLDRGLRKFNSRNLKIYRVYEHGEILAYLRYLMKAVYPVSKSHPDVIEFRVNLLDGSNMVSQHEMKALACGFFKETVGYFERPP